MELFIGPGGDARCIYGEVIDLATLGAVAIRRASHVEPDDQGRWWADLSLIGGPKLGPFPMRSLALDAEVRWLAARLPEPELHLAVQGRSSSAAPAGNASPAGAGICFSPERDSCLRSSSRSSSFSSFSSPWAGPTFGLPVVRLRRRRRFRWIRRVLLPAAMLLILAAALVLRASLRPTQPSPPPSIHQIQQLAVLATARVTVADTHETRLRGHLGQVKAVLVVRGEVLLGPDLSAASLVAIDAAERTVRIELPRPRGISARLDHELTHVASVSHAGLWVMVPGDAGRTAVINLAFAEAERAVSRAAADPALVEQASRHAERVLSGFFVSCGWRTQVEWIGPP